MFKSKKSQFLVVGVMFLSLLLVFIYSTGAPNFYIHKSGELSIFENIKSQTCKVATISNGTYIDSRFTNLSNEVSAYCTSFGSSCDLVITKSSGAPSNLSLLNYTFYNYSINYDGNLYDYLGNFSCWN